MEILVGDLFGFKNNEKYSRKWLKVDTSCLFDDSYNAITEDGLLSIHDAQVIAVRNDVRSNYSKCNYCGEIFENGKEEDHFKAKEKKDCNSCWWFQDERNYEHKPELSEIIKHEDGTFDEVFTKVMICHHSLKSCHYDSGCKCDECRKHGITKFSEKNCYFLKNPNGRFSWKMTDWLGINNFYHDYKGSDSWEELSDGQFKFKEKFGKFELYFSFSEKSFTVIGKDFNKTISEEEAVPNQYGLLPLDKKTYRKYEQQIGSIVSQVLYNLRERDDFYKKYESVFNEK